MSDDNELLVPKPEWAVKQDIRDLLSSKSADDGGIHKLYDQDPDHWLVRKGDAKAARIDFLDSSSSGETRLTVGGGYNIRSDIEAMLYGQGAHEACGGGERVKRVRSYSREEIDALLTKAYKLHDQHGVKWEDIATQFGIGVTTLWEWRNPKEPRK